MSIRNGTRRCWATDTIALVLPESKEPSSIWAPWLTTRSASTRPFSGLVCVSPRSSSSLIPPFPLIPPPALIASTAICAPRRHAWPGSARAPVTGWIAPILNVFAWARSGSGNPSAAAPVAVVARKARRVGRWVMRSLLGARSNAEQLLGDDHALDLIRALVDLHDLGVAHVPLDRELARVAVTAEDLYGVGGDLHGGVACPALGHRRLVGVAADALVDLTRGVVHHEPRRVNLHGHVGEHELDALEGGDRLAELLPLLRVCGRRVERGLADADRHRARHRPRDVERAHRDLESLALLTQALLDRHGAVREVERHGGRAADAHLLLFLADREAGRAPLDEERRDAPGALARIDRGEDGDHVGVIAVRAPLLRSVQDVVIALVHRRGPEARRVRAGSRLGQRVGGHELAGGEPRQVLLLLLLGAGQEDRQPAERMSAEVRRRTGARPAELLGHQRQREAAHVRAAVLLGHPDAEEAGLDERPHRLGRIALRLVVMRRVRRDPVARDLAGQIADHPLLFGEIEHVVHGRVSLRRSVAAGARRLARAEGPARRRRSSHCARRAGAES